MASEIQARLNRQGWRVIDRPADSAHPSIDMSKRRIHADNLVDLTNAYLRLRGWPESVDIADQVSRTCALNYWLAREQDAQQVSYPDLDHPGHARIVGWAAQGRVDILPELAQCHESHDHAAQLAERLRTLFASPHLTEPINVRHTFRIVS